ncbi:MAG TPA: phosphoribosylformylglycinamidine cyclo-ligase [Candidatus Goldiibacteriota bacterium]|nr:phosphoribosylformylglycinamidine cyclo-ligase [Candidatus Goldiibacteriota bacterium]HRQ43093.1 phosphoribosylformylglycinamidine cyclo-ligase [Candidatus Goldiibacteriota bacterium]
MAKKLSYKSAGVNIDAAVDALSKAKAHIKSTFNKKVVTDIGSYGGVFDMGAGKCTVASTDGVGTKLKIAQNINKHDTVGQDIVNHCVNDILVMGAKPLFFLDYFGCGKLEGKVLVDVISGMAKACRENGTVLIGGETAEMPGVYKDGEYDLVGTIVGEVEKKKILTGKKVKPGNAVIGIGSYGLQTNGFSLARRVFESNKIPYTKYIPELKTTLGLALLEPHRSFLKSVYPLVEKGLINAMSHITGGGFYDNIVRVLPDNVDCVVKKGSWEVLPIFKMIQKLGGIEDREMHRVFNMGVGMVLIVPADKAKSVVSSLKKSGERAWLIGNITKGSRKVTVV